MTFLWPDMFFLLLLVPALVALYMRLIGRTKQRALRYANLTRLKDALGLRSRVRQHIPPALLLVGFIVLIVALARPAAIVVLPSERGTVILAMDVSGSMRAADVDPDRITAAQIAAKQFVAAQPVTTRVGIVAFAATAFLVQSPTLDRDEAIKAIDRFQTQFGTAVGSGILVALRTIFPDIQVDDLLGFDGSGTFYGRRSGAGRGPLGGAALGDPAAKPEPEFQPVPPGSNKSNAIVLLSDGRTMNGPDPIEAARVAANRGIRVFTVGFGTPHGVIPGFGGSSIYTQPDDATLKQIADMTGGAFFHADTAPDLSKIFRGIATQTVMEKEKTEITAMFAAAAAIIMVLGATLSLLWFNRIA